VSESYAADRDYGRCLAYVGTTPERAQESLDVLMNELKRINGTPPPPAPEPSPKKVMESAAAVELPPPPPPGITGDEFTTALVGIKSRIIFSGESTSGRAHALASDHHKRGKARSLDEISASYDALTLDQINEYLTRRTLGPTTIVTLGPAALKAPVPAAP
jgi:predicted Zn-dependent peptidase